MGFEPTISAGERPKTYALDRAATGTGIFGSTILILKEIRIVSTEKFGLLMIIKLDQSLTFFPHSCTMHLDTIKVFYLPTDAQ